MSTDEWESGFQSLGPPRYRTFWHPLTKPDHPKRFWELCRLESNPLPVGKEHAVQIEIELGELFELVGGVLRFSLAAIWVRAKAFLSMRLYRASLFGMKDRRLNRREF